MTPPSTAPGKDTSAVVPSSTPQVPGRNTLKAFKASFEADFRMLVSSAALKPGAFKLGWVQSAPPHPGLASGTQQHGGARHTRHGGRAHHDAGPDDTCPLSSSATGARAKAWCLLIHADASLSLSHFQAQPEVRFITLFRR
jgi:hypothetical protein